MISVYRDQGDESHEEQLTESAETSSRESLRPDVDSSDDTKFKADIKLLVILWL
jgi:hypothetical protein